MRPGSGPRHAVGLHRVSTAEQGQRGLGLEAQQASVRAFVAGQGWALVAEYSDTASGKDDRRPGFQAALAHCRQLRALGGDRGHRPVTGPDAATASAARREAAERAAHRLALEVERLRADGMVAHAAMARALTERGVPTPRGRGAWTHTTVARVLARAGG